NHDHARNAATSPHVVGAGKTDNVRRGSMINRFLISAAAIALIAGAPAVYTQGNMNRDGGAATQQSAPTGNAGGAATEKTEKNAPGGMKSTQSEQKSPGAAKGQRA